MKKAKTLPNFLIIGAMKAATTSLYTYLKQHPEVFMTSIKEPKFFNNIEKRIDFKPQGKGLKKISTIEQYHSLFINVKSEIAIGEASPSYIFDEECSVLIHKYIPETKIIAILRQPVERAYSNFLHAKRSGKEKKLSFEAAFEEKDKRKDNEDPKHYYMQKGYYTEQLDRYYKLFPKKNIKILLFDEVIKNPTAASQEIFKFLKVNSSFIPDTRKKENVSGTPNGMLGWIIMKFRYYNLMPDINFRLYLPDSIITRITKLAYKKTSPLNKNLRSRLTNKFYKTEILNLEKMINKDLRHWLE